MRKYNVVFGMADNTRASIFVHAHASREAVSLASKKLAPSGVDLDFIKVRYIKHIRNYHDFLDSKEAFV